jgi:hypothetical protein
MPRSSERKRAKVLGLLGIGLDATDGQRRLTRGDNFLLAGGSAETHEMMQETVIKLEEALEKRGKRLQDAEAQEVVDLLHQAQE